MTMCFRLLPVAALLLFSAPLAFAQDGEPEVDCDNAQV